MLLSRTDGGFERALYRPFHSRGLPPSISPQGATTMDEKTYRTPEIIYEGELEVQAGSPLGSDPLDPLGFNLED